MAEERNLTIDMQVYEEAKLRAQVSECPGSIPFYTTYLVSVLVPYHIPGVPVSCLNVNYDYPVLFASLVSSQLLNRK